MDRDWTQPYLFREQNIRVYAPKRVGVYQVGYYKKRSKNFMPFYIGRAKHLNQRLLYHYSGRGNKRIGDYVLKHRTGQLYFRTKTTKSENEAKCIESCELLTHFKQGEKYKWNEKKEYYACTRHCERCPMTLCRRAGQLYNYEYKTCDY